MSEAVFLAKPYDLALLAQELADFTPSGGEVRGDGSLVIEFDYEPTVEQWQQITAIVEAHQPDENRQLGQLVEKARQVWNGQGTFTQAQAQKILAGLVLLENRRR